MTERVLPSWARSGGCDIQADIRPTRAPECWREVRGTIGTAGQGKAPATADIIGKMLKPAPATVIGVRDPALLCLGFAAALRRSELCALDVSDLVEVPDGMRLTIRRSRKKGSAAGHAIPPAGAPSPRSCASPNGRSPTRPSYGAAGATIWSQPSSAARRPSPQRCAG